MLFGDISVCSGSFGDISLFDRLYLVLSEGLLHAQTNTRRQQQAQSSIQRSARIAGITRIVRVRTITRSIPPAMIVATEWIITAAAGSFPVGEISRKGAFGKSRTPGGIAKSTITRSARMICINL